MKIFAFVHRDESFSILTHTALVLAGFLVLFPLPSPCLKRVKCLAEVSYQRTVWQCELYLSQYSKYC